MSDDLESKYSGLFQQLVAHYGTRSAALKALAKIAGYVDVPPTIQEFLSDSYFAGTILGGSLYPIWKQQLGQIFPNQFNCPYLEIAATGAIGTGKSTLCEAGMFYDLTRVLYLRDPHSTFQLIKSTPIVIAFINTTLTLSQSVLANQFKEWVNDSPFFQDQMAKVPAQRNKREKRDWLPHKISLLSGSRGGHALGRATIMGMLSELNFQGQSVKDQAINNYVQLKRRMESRFGRDEGLIIPGRLWLDSSKSDEAGFLEQHLKELQKEEALGRAMIICKPIWDVMQSAGKKKLSGKRVPVFIGDQNSDPRILDDGPHPTLGVSEGLIVHVPIEYMDHFRVDIYGALRDYAGVSTWSSHKFLPHEHLVKSALCLNNPVTKQIVELDFDNDDDQLINYVDIPNLPKDYPYCIHFDLGIKRDRTGIALTRCMGEVVVERKNNMLLHTMTRDLIFETPLAMAVRARPGKEVPLSKMRNFIVHLVQRGVKIVAVSADGWQSKELLQHARKLGLTDTEISTVRTRDVYDHFKDCILEKRWTGAYHEVLEKELLELRDNGKDIDHPLDQGTREDERPSKDIADAVAGSVYNCKQLNLNGKAVHALQQYGNHLKEVKAAEKVTDKQLLAEQMKRFGKPGRRGGWGSL